MNEHEHDSRANINSQQAVSNDSSHESIPHASSSTGDDVLSILADVEQKFDRLREFQRKQEHELTSLEQRRLMLDETERELDQELNTLVQHRNALEESQKELDHQREQIARQGADLARQNETIDAQRRELAEQTQLAAEKKQALERRAAELEQQSEALAQQRNQWQEHRKHAEAEQRDQQQAMEHQREELTRLDQAQRAGSEKVQQQRAELQAAEQQFEQRRELWKQQSSQRGEELQQKSDALEKQFQQLSAEQKALEDEQLELMTGQEQLQHGESALAQRTRSLEAAQAEVQRREQQAVQQLEAAGQKLADAQQQAQQWRDALEQAQSQSQQFESDLEATRAEMQQAEKDRDEARAQVSQLIEDVERLGGNVDELRATVAEGERRLSLAGEKLKHFAEILNEQSSQLERGAAAMAMVEDQHRQIEQLSNQLADAMRAGNPDELRRKEQRIAELTEALRQARGQIGGDTSVADLQLEMAELSRQNDAMRIELEHATAAGQRAEQMLKQQQDTYHEAQARAQERHHALEALKAEHALAIQVIETEHDEAIRQARSGREDQVRALQEKIGKLQESLIETKQRGAAGKGGADVTAYQTRIAELEEQLTQSRSSGENAEQAKSELRAKAKKLSEAAHHLARRRQRLDRAKELLRQRVERSHAEGHPSRGAKQQETASKADRDDMARQLRGIEQQRRELHEVRQFLSHSERELMKRWARPRAVSSAGWLVLLTVVSAVASWFAADIFFPAPVTASVTFAPQPANPTTFTATDASNWQQWHAEYILSPEFHAALARRCDDRRLEPYGSETELAARLSKDLDIDLSEPKRLTATLQGENRAQTQLLLDMLTGTLSLESARQMDRRADNAKAVPIDERKENGRVMYASMSPAPPIQDRLKYIGPIFGGIMLTLFAVMIFVYSRLVRSKRVFEAEQELFIGNSAEGEFTAV